MLVRAITLTKQREKKLRRQTVAVLLLVAVSFGIEATYTIGAEIPIDGGASQL